MAEVEAARADFSQLHTHVPHTIICLVWRVLGVTPSQVEPKIQDVRTEMTMTLVPRPTLPLLA